MSKFICVFAHPDDESFLVGGTICHLVSLGHQVDLICCTDGNHQDKGLKSVRSVELQNAVNILQISNLFHLDFADGYLCNANYHLLASKIRSILDDVQPDTIITFHPNGVSGHLDHIAVTSVVNYLFSQLSYIKSIWYFTKLSTSKKPQNYFVYHPDGESPEKIDLTIDTSPYIEKQLLSVKAHQSQAEDINRVVNRLTTGPKAEHFLVRSKSE